MLRKIGQDEIGEFYEKLYTPYIEEIKAFGGKDGMQENDLRYNLCNTPMDAYVFMEGDEEVGFILAEKVLPPEIYTAMLFIVEFYVVPEHRRRGIGSSSFREVLEMTDIPVFFTVLDGNRVAQAFWRRIIAMNRLLPVRPDSRQLLFAVGKQLYCFRKRG